MLDALLEAGADMTLRFAAGLELMDRRGTYFTAGDPPASVETRPGVLGLATVADSLRHGICATVALS